MTGRCRLDMVLFNLGFGSWAPPVADCFQPRVHQRDVLADGVLPGPGVRLLPSRAAGELRRARGVSDCVPCKGVH